MTKPNAKITFTWLLFAVIALPVVVYSNGCEDCHSDPDFYVQSRKIHTYYQNWIKSPHKEAGLSCNYCHGGDASTADKQTAHKDILHVTDPKSRLYFKNLPETCGNCHADKLKQFKQSKHYKALMADTVAPSCTTCHSAMNARPNYRDILEKSCRTCHNEENAPSIPLVADRAGEYLHRLSIARVYLGWTKVYYESQGWPLNTKQEVGNIAGKYDEAVTRVHSFDLIKMDESSNEILVTLEAMFKEAWNEKKELE